MSGTAKSMPLVFESANTARGVECTCSGNSIGKLFADMPNYSCLQKCRRAAASDLSAIAERIRTLGCGTVDALVSGRARVCVQGGSAEPSKNRA